MSRDKYKDYTDEQYPPYEEYLSGAVWPSVGRGGEIKHTYIDQMAPQHAASAIYKLKRWNASQWMRDEDVDRKWKLLQDSTLLRMLQARASGLDDYSEIMVQTTTSGVNTKGAAHILVRMMLEGADDLDDPLVVAKLATRAAENLYAKGYVIILDPF